MQAKLEYFGTKIGRRRSPTGGIGLFVQPWNSCREELWRSKGIIAKFIKIHQLKCHLFRFCNSPGRREALGTSCKHIPDCQPWGCGYVLRQPVTYGAFSHPGPWDLLPWCSELCTLPWARSGGQKHLSRGRHAGRCGKHPCPRHSLQKESWDRLPPDAVTRPPHGAEPPAQPELGEVCHFGRQWVGASLGLWGQLQHVSASGRTNW